MDKNYKGRVWMHCESGLKLNKASMARFMMYVLKNDVEIGDIYAFNRNHSNSEVICSVRLREDQFMEFEQQTGGKLRYPPKIILA